MDWLQVVAPPLLMIAGGVITWLLKSRAEELRATEQRLLDERRKIYGQILDPYVHLFAGLKTGHGQAQALKKVTSYEYRKTAFELSLVGSDDVVRAYNDLMQHTYKSEQSGEGSVVEMMRLWGALLLAIRRSLGNKTTKLDRLDMLRGMITDIDSIAGVSNSKRKPAPKKPPPKPC